MRLASVDLRNFRSFGPDPDPIQLPDTGVLALVGANNSGKSNLLDALRLVLGRRRYTPNSADFHRLDVTQEIRITLRLREPLRRENIYHREDRISGFFLRVWQSDQPADRGQLKSEHYCLDGEGKTYVPPAAVKKTAGKELDPEVEPVPWRPALARDILPLLGPVHYLEPTLYRAFDTTGLVPLAQLLDIYREDFRSADNQYRAGEWQGTRAQAFSKTRERMIDILSTDSLNEIEESLTRHLSDLLGPTGEGARIGVEFPTAEELLGTALRLYAQDDPDGPNVPVDRLGAGYRSLLRLAILQVFRELAPVERGAVFLIEEPEAYLNPQLRRHFRSVLAGLGDAGHDVIFTTHDPAFVRVDEYRTVVRIEKRDGLSIAHKAEAGLDFSYERMARKLRHGGNAELFFASKAILGEGQDDAAVIRVLLERLGVDPDRSSVSIVDCGGRENIPDYARLLDQLKIDFLVVSDGDRTKAAEKEEVAKQVQAVRDAVGVNALFLFEEDVETAFATEKTSDNAAHLAAAAEKFNLESGDDASEVTTLARALETFMAPANT